jgi:hypothetical protein
MALKSASQLMQSPAWSIHVLHSSRVVKSKKLNAQLIGVFRLDTGFRTISKKQLDSIVPETLYHQIYCIVRLYSMSIFFELLFRLTGVKSKRGLRMYNIHKI